MALLELDRQVPALLVKVGDYTVHSGGVGAMRTLGRLGVPVYIVTENAFTPAARSRYCTGWFRWKTTGREDRETLVEGLRRIGEQLGRRCVAVPTDDEAATLLAEHAGELSRYFIQPDIQPGLPRQLASKHQLYQLCGKYGVPAPSTMHLTSSAELASFARSTAFPVVVKNAEPWVRHRAPVVGGTTVLHTAQELHELSETRPLSLLAQEYIPQQAAEDWIVHLYCDANSDALVLFTGVKVRSWPSHAGATACAYAVPNSQLASMTSLFCKKIGFKGIGDLDWRYDRRDGQYKLLDFNPRTGNQFRLFETDAGVDVVRALHLDLTGRAIPIGKQVSGRKLVVEHFDVQARLADRGSTETAPSAPQHTTSTELAWIARDDPMPFLVMMPWFAKALISHRLRHTRWWKAPAILKNG